MSCVTWSKLANLSGLQFEHLQNREAVLEGSELLTQALIFLVLKEGLPPAQPKSLKNLNYTDRK